MDQMSKIQQVLDVIDRKKTGRIPVIPVTTKFAVSRSPYSFAECDREPEKFVEAIVEGRRRFGYDGLWTDVFQGITAVMGKGLTDKHVRESVTGQSTIQEPEDLPNMRPFSIDACGQLHTQIEIIKALKKAEPDEPVFTIIDNPCMVAADLMDGANYYYHMLINPEFVHEMTEIIFEPLQQCTELLIDAGADVIWLPLPTVGGTCISRTLYEEFCTKYNKRFNDFILSKGAHLMVHTCGNWNDRLDLAVAEGAHALHISETDLKAAKAEIGGEVALMGQVPCVPVMMNGDPEMVYRECLEECLTGAAGGGFILSADCGLPPMASDENMKAMIQAAKDAEKQLAGQC